ncbi:LysR substrate-binding domain-containing protein [Roseibium sp. M-1]
MSRSNRPLPSLNGLKAFEAAARHLNFRMAAEELGVTQGAVAQHVRAIEADFDIKLFERLPKGLVLTGPGRRYSADIRRAFELISSATEELRPSALQVTISTTPTFASKWLIPRLSRLTEALPDLEVHIVAAERLARFSTDGVDIAVRYTNPPFGQGLEGKLLLRQEIVAVASPTLFGANDMPSTAEDLQDYPLLHDTHNFWPRFIEEAASGNTTRLIKNVSFNQTAHAIEAAIAGQGIALADFAFIEGDLKDGRLVLVSQKRIGGPADFHIVRPRYRKSQQIDDLVAWLLQEIPPHCRS